MKNLPRFAAYIISVDAYWVGENSLCNAQEEIDTCVRLNMIAVVLGRGGHTAQTFALVNLLGERFDYLYLIGILDSLTPKKIQIPGRVMPVVTPRLLPQDSRIMSAIRTLVTLLLAFVYFLFMKPKAVISCGTGLTVPIFLAAKALSIRTIFVESMSRVESLSKTGRILLGRTDLFLVQWKSLAEKIPTAEYGGQLL